MAYLTPAQYTLATARLALKTTGTGTIGPAGSDPGAMLDLTRVRCGEAGGIRRRPPSGVLPGPPAPQVAQAPGHLEAFWAERNQMIRQLMRDGDYRNAYDLAAAHGQKEPSIVVEEAEFLAGFIALRKLNKPKLAATHFTALATASPAVLTQSREYYWLGRAVAASGGDTKAFIASRAAASPTRLSGPCSSTAWDQI